MKATYCIRCLRRSCADCRVGDAVEVSRMPEWDSALESHSFHPARPIGRDVGATVYTLTQARAKAETKPWRFQLTSIPGLHDPMDWVWVRVV